MAVSPASLPSVTAARFRPGADSPPDRREKAPQSLAIFRLVASLKGRMVLDYTMRSIDEMTTQSRNGRNQGMTDKAAAKLKSDGWKIVETSGFLHLIGPLWQRVVDGTHEYALITEDKH